MIIIYELLKANVPVYVGSTNNLKRRIWEHGKPSQFVKRYGFKFDSFRAIEKTTKEDRFKREQLYHELYLSLGFPIVGQIKGTSIPNNLREKMNAKARVTNKTEESKHRRSMSQLGHVVSDENKRKMQLAIKTNKKIMDHNGTIYHSIHECSRVTGCCRDCISKCLNGKMKQTKGFTFKGIL